MKLPIGLLCGVLCAGVVAIPVRAAILVEGFDDTAVLPGIGWTIKNNSSPAGLTAWYQGNTIVFSSESGAANSYIAANYYNTGAVGTISDWLIAPEYLFSNGDSLRFFTRTVTSPASPDRLEVRFSSNGASTDVGSSSTSVGDFTTSLLTINSGLTTSGYPNDWTEYTVVLSGLSGTVPGRFAFRYFVTDGGQNGSNSDYIGIDSVAFDVASVPEPGSVILVGLGLVALAGRLRRRKA